MRAGARFQAGRPTVHRRTAGLHRPILAGIRVATVTTIGTAAIAAAIGAGGLGVFIFRGISMVDTPTVLQGAIPAALMAVAADEGLEWLTRRVSAA